MSITAQQYAALAENSYDTTRKSGVRPPSERERVNADGVVFEVLEHVDNRTNGYAGTVYQRIDTGDIVVAHRGTNEILRDGIIADAGMVLNRSNWQANDALALTKRALGYAKESAAFFSGSPEVTVTGHSLGGALAQISAHHYDLKGHTYNAYGAASLNRRIPEGGDKVTNHVMATDPVGAASAHYGQVRVYAIPEEIQELHRNGYVNNNIRGGVTDWMSRRATGAMPNSLKSHEMNNFLDVDRDGKPDVSVLNDPKAQKLAQDNAVMIDKYRSDVRNTRGGISAVGDALSPAGMQNMKKLVDTIRGPLPAGEGLKELQKNEPPTNDKHSSLVPDIDKDPHAFLDQMVAAGQSGDNAKFRAFTQSLAQSDVAQEFHKNTMAEVDRLEEQAKIAETQVAERAQQEQQQQQEQEQKIRQGPIMRG